MRPDPPLALQPDEIAGDRMHMSLAELREARKPWWASAADWLRAQAGSFFKQVPADACPNCEAEKLKARRWQERAGEWATLCLAHEKAEEALAAQLVAARKELRETTVPGPVTDADLAVAFDTPLLGQSARRDRYAMERVGKPATHQEPEPRGKACIPLKPGGASLSVEAAARRGTKHPAHSRPPDAWPKKRGTQAMVEREASNATNV